MTSLCDRLRAEYPTFVYESYAWRRPTPGALDCSFRFRVGDITFAPRCTFTFSGAPTKPVASEVMDNLVFHLGLAELPSYWKATCSPRVEVQAGPLDAEAIAFWTCVLTEGMGEFHCVNQTPFTDPGFVTVTGGPTRSHRVLTEPLADGHVVPVGGGKDSLLTLDLLANRRDAVAALAINPPPSTEQAVRVAGVEPWVSIERRLDPRLLELNQQGYLDGHTPFGAVIGFASALAAVVLGHRHIVLSNESSADHTTVRYRGQVINHQWGKSSAFETKLHHYLVTHVATDLDYFSLLRPFGELRIAQAFSRLGDYHYVFRSCNRGRKTDSWCGRCAKCLSTFIVLRPFMPPRALEAVFGGDLLAVPACQALLPSLLDEGEARPFECIATPDELRVALALGRGERLTPASVRALTRLGPQGLVPDDLYDLVDAALRPQVVPLLDHAAVGVLGLGLEGADTCRHLLSEVEPLDLTVLDDDPAAQGRLPPSSSPARRIRFASEAPDLDILFKSPGVPPDHPALIAGRARPTILTSNTALFFERCVGTILGVTGTKGKSTTTSLIAHVLRAAGRDARLVGNIGHPCLTALDDDRDAIFCVELSSFQLEGLPQSPHIAVILGMFPDHLDRYADMADYVAAKASIARHQRRRDLVLYNADCPHATAVASLSAARRVPFRRERPDLLLDGRSPLLGEFNHVNLWPAILVGRHLGIDDATLAAAIATFIPLPGRLETVAEHRGLRFICDIRSTAPEVTVAALDALRESHERVDFVLLGGVDRQQDYEKLVPALARASVRHVLLFPPTGRRIRRILGEAALDLAIVEPRSMEEAIRYVYDHAPAGPGLCLMSTAAPSNGGLFAGPEDKARQFAHHARVLGEAVP